jgi:hypothetical protein
MTPAETIATWRAEIEAEIAEAERDLAEAEAALIAAAEARDAAQIDHRRIAAMIADLVPPDDAHRLWGSQKPAAPASLLRRGDPAARAATQAEGAVALAKQLVANAKYRLADTREALAAVTAQPNQDSANE